MKIFQSFKYFNMNENLIPRQMEDDIRVYIREQKSKLKTDKDVN